MKYLKTIFMLISIWVYNFSISAQTYNIFELGHSLVNHDMPAMLQSLCDDASEVNHSYELGIINGAPLFWHWDNPDDCVGYQAGFVNSKTELASGDYDIFVMTEGVPWDPIMDDFFAYADSFYTLAITGNPDLQLFLLRNLELH